MVGFKGGSGEGGGAEFSVGLFRRDRGKRVAEVVEAGHSSVDERAVLVALARLAVGHDELARAAGIALAREILARNDNNDEGTVS